MIGLIVMRIPDLLRGSAAKNGLSPKRLIMRNASKRNKFRRILPLLSAVVLAMVVLFGCSAGPDVEDAGPAIGQQTLESAEWVRNTAQGSWRAGEEWRLVPDLWIGTLEGDRADFGRLGQVAVDGWGRVFALDRLNHEVRLFDGQGRFVRTFARRGPGPGEILQPTGIFLAPEGDLWIVDAGNQRYTVFDSAGSFLHVHRVPGMRAVERFRGGLVGDSVVDLQTRHGSGYFVIHEEAKTTHIAIPFSASLYSPLPLKSRANRL